MPVASLADIIRSKEAAARPEDFTALPALQERLIAQQGTSLEDQAAHRQSAEYPKLRPPEPPWSHTRPIVRPTQFPARNRRRIVRYRIRERHMPQCWVVESIDQVWPPGQPRSWRGHGRTAWRPEAWPTREQPLAEHNFVPEPIQFQSVSNDPLLPEDLSQLDPMVCIHVLVRAPTEWLVRSDHHARCVHDVLDRCQSPDVGRAQVLQPLSSRSRTRPPPTSTASWRADTDIRRGTSTSTSTKVTSRVTGVTRSSLQLQPVELEVPLKDGLGVRHRWADRSLPAASMGGRLSANSLITRHVGPGAR